MNQHQAPDLVSSIPSRALEVWRRLYTRYTLEPGPATVGPDVLKTIVPVTQADQLLARHRGVVVDTTVTGTIDHLVATVPLGIRRAFVTLLIQRITGTWTFDTVSLTDVSEGANVRIAPQAQTDNFQLDPQSAPIEVEEGDEVHINVDSHSVNGTCRLAVWVIDQDIF